ncbi:MAG: hypothetical protein LBK95_19945 [Bifidobacteriaceae bacterium]|jgi:hypothetical protein|nr:hypothetical protein [Bifidobacteriaceae bacterium]
MHMHRHGPEWLFSARDPETAREAFADHVSALAEALSAGGSVQLAEDVIVEVPETVGFELRYERPPHGGYALLVRVEWPDCLPQPRALPVSGLSIRPAAPARAA